jgi:hypothetical protein
MRNSIKTVLSSKRVHLCLGLLALYGISWAVTHTTRLEKIVDTFKNYSEYDHKARVSKEPYKTEEYKFLREKYKDRLISLSEGLFDYQDRKQTQAFFLSHDFLYEVSEGSSGNSYLLARVIEKGHHEAEVPERVSFDYYVLGEKEIVPFEEYRDGKNRRNFVSAGDEAIYIHEDSLKEVIGRYFESLWSQWDRDSLSDKEIRERSEFYWDDLSHCLSRDLQGVIDVAITMRIYERKGIIRDHFIEEGFKVFLPAMLAMGARLTADQELSLSSGHRYQRALLTGFSLKPNFTMVYLCKDDSLFSVKKVWKELNGKLHMDDLEKIDLYKISRVAQEVLEKLKDSETTVQ